MRLSIITIIVALYPAIAQAIDVTLAWDANTEEDMSHYTLYQADRFEGKTGPWSTVKTIDKEKVATIVAVEVGKNFAWYLTATDTSGNETQASNTVSLYDKVAPVIPVNFRKVQGE